MTSSQRSYNARMPRGVETRYRNGKIPKHLLTVAFNAVCRDWDLAQTYCDALLLEIELES